MANNFARAPQYGKAPRRTRPTGKPPVTPPGAPPPVPPPVPPAQTGSPPHTGTSAPVPNYTPTPGPAGTRGGRGGLGAATNKSANPDPTATPTPAPATPENEAARINAESTYETTMAGINRQLYEAALRYGDPTTLARFSAYGPTVDNPNSDLSMAQRQFDEQRTGLVNAALRANTLFSSNRLTGENKLSDAHDRARLAAYQRFLSSQGGLTDLGNTALGTRNEAINTANAGDITAALSRPPEPTGKLPPNNNKTKKQRGKKQERGSGGKQNRGLLSKVGRQTVQMER